MKSSNKLLKTLIQKETISISMALLIIVLGLFSMTRIAIRMFPEITQPIISISTLYPGASAEVVKGYVTSRLEDGIAGLPNINYITATSSQGSSQIQVHLMPDTPIESALIHVTEKVNEEKAYLPAEVQSPMVKQASNESESMIIAFTTKEMSRVQVVEYLNRVLKPELEVIDGVGDINVLGPEYALKIHLNPSLLTAYSLTATDVLDALKNQNVLSQTGNLEGEKTNFNLDTLSYFDTPKVFNDLLIKETNNNVIRLSDIGHANFEASNDKVNVFYNSQQATMVFVHLISGANPLTISTKIQEKLLQLEKHLPYDLKCKVVLNISDYINHSIGEVWDTLGIAFLVIVLVLIFFLGSFSAMSIPLIAIPVSLIGGLFLMNCVGFSINTLTLLAMVLAVGLVVDDAIVVVENIFRYLPQCKTRAQAAYQGTQEIIGPVISMTLTLSAVFAPVFFIGGMTGRLFSEFAFAMAASVLISGFISLTLTPMMCAKLLPKHYDETKIWSSRFMHYTQQKYQILLDFIFRKKFIALSFWIVSILGCFMLYQMTPKELSPQEDPGYIIVMGSGPTNANQHYILGYRDKIEQAFSSIPNVKESVFLQGTSGLNSIFGFITLSDDKKRLSAMALLPVLQDKLKKIIGMNTYAMVPSQLPGDGGSGVQFVIVSNADYRKMHAVSEVFKKKAMASGLFAYVNHDLNYNQPHFQLDIHRDALEAHHVSMSNISTALALLTGEFESQQFTYFGRSYDVILSADQKFRQSPDQLGNIMVRNNQDILIPLSDLMNTKMSIQPSSLNEFQKQNSVTFNAVLAPDVSLSQAMNYIQQASAEILPEDMHYDYTGQTRQYQEENTRFIQVFALSLIVVFLILSIQFNSFRDASLILLGSVPMTLFVALIPLALHFGSINIYTQIALLTLVGLITKHGVLMTQFANQLKETGVNKLLAIRQAAQVRFRPILMTTVAMALGALPLVMATGAGSVSRFQIGLTIFVGISVGTLCTLFIFPVLYQLFSKEVMEKSVGTL